MPRCTVRHVKLVAEADLPILPFLAPRVFQPWPVSPSPSSRTLYTSARNVTPRREVSCHNHQDQGRNFSTQSRQQAGQTRRHRTPNKKEELRTQNARSLLASQWYQEAIAPIESQQAKKSALKDGGKKDERPKRLSRQETLKRDWKKRTTNRSILKTRLTASKRGTESARTKWVSVGHPVRRRPRSPSDKEVLGYTVEEDYLIWNHHFAKLNARYDSRLERRPHESNTPVLNFDAPQWASQIRKNANANKNLEKLLGPDWRKKWMHAMLWTLAHSVDDAARLLEVSHVTPYLSASWIADSMNYLAQHYSRHKISEEARDYLVHVLCTLMERPGSSPLRLTGSPLRGLQNICDKEQVLRLYESAVVNGVILHWNTRLHFATYLAHHGHYDQALDALLDAVADGADVSSPQFESNCATILRKAADQPDGLRVGLRMVQNLADIGVKLNVQLCNIVMLSAVEADDLKTAFSIYHSLVEHNLSADKYTHAILLKGCKSAIQDSETLNTTIRQAISDTEILKSPVVATEIVHCLYLHHFQTDPTRAFSTVTEAYAQLFDTSELIRLRILPATYDNESSGKMRATVPVLGIMIAAHLRQTLSDPYRRKGNLPALYQHWHTLVRKGRQPYAKLAESDYVFNAFLLAFTNHPSTLPQAAEVIRDMQTPMPVPEGLDPAQFNSTPCQPTVQTWSIFLHGFAKFGKTELAEQVLTYMRDRGMQPNQVTWNSLVGGYAKVGDSEGAVSAFKRMRDEGFKVNEITERALSKIRLDHVTPEAWGRGGRVEDSGRRRVQREHTRQDAMDDDDGGFSSLSI